MNLFEMNLETWRQVAPGEAEQVAATPIPADYRIEPARNGQPILKRGALTLHSVYDPGREGETWAKNLGEVAGQEPLIVFGLGLGYHVQPLLAQGRRLVVVEPDAAVARLALETMDLRPLLAQDALVVGAGTGKLPWPAHLATHTPTFRAHRQAYEDLKRWLEGEAPPDRPVARPRAEIGAEPGPGKKHTVLVVSPLYGGTYPIAQYCTKAFQKLGHRAEMLDHAPYYPAYQAIEGAIRDPQSQAGFKQRLLSLVAETMLHRIGEVQPDVLFVLPFAPLDAALMERIRAGGVKIVYWFVEDYQVFPFWRELAPAVDLFLTIQEEPFHTELRRLGVRRAELLPLGADPELFRPLALSAAEQEEWGSDLAFVGAGYANRRRLFPALSDFDFKIWGSDWEEARELEKHIQLKGRRIAPEECAKIFNATRINLNLHSSPVHAGINPQGDYLNPRVFDLAAAGAFQLVDWRSQLPRFFQPGEELVIFRSLKELRDLIRHYLAHPEERQVIAERARQRVLKEHTFEHRMAAVLRLLEEGVTGDQHREGAAEIGWRGTAEPEAVRREQEPPAGDTDLEGWLASLPPGQDRSLAGLAAAIEAGQGPLRDPEAMVLFLHELGQGLARGRL